MKERRYYFDTIKLFAIFVVFTTHFVATFNDSYFRFWTDLPTAILLKGVSGKFGVAIFSVILGYFAYRSSERNVFKYAVKRYAYFLICALFINGIYALCMNAGYLEGSVSLQHYLRTSFFLSDRIYETFWCIQPFMLASVISRINGRFGAGLIIVTAEIALFIWLGQLWVGICLMGNLTYLLEQNASFTKLISRRAARIVIYIAAFLAIKRSGSDLTYMIDGASAALVLAALSKSERIAPALNNRHLASAGRNTMAIYLIHNIIYENLGALIVNDNNFVATFIIAFIVCWAVIVLVSYPLTAGLNAANKACGRVIDKVFGLFAKPTEGKAA